MKRIFAAVLILMFAAISCGDDSEKVDYDVVIIGSGGGGLSAGARLALAGKKIIVIEQHYKVGGYMGAFKRGDYTFEISLHAMDGLDPENGAWTPMLKELGVYDKLKPVKLDPMYKAYFPGFEMTVPADAQEYKKMLLERFPHEKQGIEDYWSAIGSIHEIIAGGNQIMQGNYLSGLWQVMTSPVGLYEIASCMGITMSDFLNRFFKDKALLTVMTCYTCMLGNGPDKIAATIFAGMWDTYHKGGTYYLEGGSKTMSEGLAEVIRSNGGEILLSTRVTKVLIKDGKAIGVQTKDGKKISSKYVISNANALDTMLEFVGKEYLPADYVEELTSMEIGAAALTIYMGVNKDYRDYFPGDTHMIMEMPSLDPDENFRPMREGDPHTVQYGITNYSKADPTVAPKGKNVIAIVTLMPYDLDNGWMEDVSDEAYQKYKKKVADIIIKRVEKYLPGLSKHIEELEVGTPRTNMHYTSNRGGSIYGWAHSDEQSLMNRLPQETPVENLLLAGAWTYPAGGQTPVIFSGYTAAGKVLDDMD